MVARGGDLQVVGKSGRIMIGGSLMPRARAFAVISLRKIGSVPPRASATTTATSLADFVTIALIAVSTRMFRPA